MALKTDLIVDAYSHIGYHGMNVGDHDLVLGGESLLERRPRAKFPFISSNLIDIDARGPMFEPCVVSEIAGLRVGIFGLLSPVFKPQHEEGKYILVEDPFEAAANAVRELKGKMCDFIVALSLLRGREEAERLASEVPGINVIVSGCGAPLLQPVKVGRTIIVQTRIRGECLGRLDLNIVGGSFDFKNAAERQRTANRLKVAEASLENFRQKAGGEDLGEYYKEDPATLKEVKNLNKRLRELKETLKTLSEGSSYANSLIRLDDSHPDDPEISRMVEEYKEKVAQLKRKPPSS